MLDVGLLMLVVLAALGVWRYVLFYRCCGLWLSILNYVALLYMIMAGALVYLSIQLYHDASLELDVASNPELEALWDVKWLRPFILAAPGAVFATLALNWLQTDSHLFEIHKRSAVDKHDRAIQIIALPTVFSVMCMASMLPIFALISGTIDAKELKSPWNGFVNPFEAAAAVLLQGLPGTSDDFGRVATGNMTLTNITRAADAAPWEQAQGLAFWRYETCYYVGDIFEAWALFQFGKLVLEQVGESITVRETDEENYTSKLEQDLVDSHRAVTILTWMGTSMFVAVCVLQSVLSLWPYLGGDPTRQDLIMTNLYIAGFVVSCAAIYNLVVVEQAFHRHLKPISPVLKFISVKFLVSLSFMQNALIGFGQKLNVLLPGAMQKVISYIPLVGEILQFSELQKKLFYSSLVIFECLLLSLMHLCVWRASEAWYETGELEPLMAKPVPASQHPSMLSTGPQALSMPPTAFAMAAESETPASSRSAT